MSRETILLKEYEVCQQEASDTGSYSWQSGLIFFVTTLALAGAVITGLANVEVSPYRLILITVLGIFSIALLYVWKKYLTRQNLIRKIMFHRMEMIERNLNMRKSLYVSFLDETLRENPLNDDEKEILLEKFGKNTGRKPQGLKLTMYVVKIAITAWLILIILESVLYFCPLCHTWFFNLL